jgi:hypothetical protein
MIVIVQSTAPCFAAAMLAMLPRLLYIVSIDVFQ